MNLIYLARPIYGGWINFTVHLSLLTNSNIYKITKKTEKKQRNFGFNLTYRNLCIQDIIKLEDICIVALDKHYYHFLKEFPDNTKLVIHDPTEIKNLKNPLISENLIQKFSILTIRNTVKKYLQEQFNILSTFIYHPFYKYPRLVVDKHSMFAVSTSRIDYDKHIDIILKANLLLPDDKKIYIYGKENRLCVHHKLKDLEFNKYWKGKYEKQLQILFEDKDLLQNTKYLIDLSTIKNDGGGTQYTFLDGIYNNCVLILHEEWANKGDLFINNYNCLTVRDENDLFKLLSNEIPDSKINIILNNSKKILEKVNENPKHIWIQS
tara:strand:- start:1531 stop:2496 length:966 start_codon:yes stop_codon:yes gene_type:complete